MAGYGYTSPFEILGTGAMSMPPPPRQNTLDDLLFGVAQKYGIDPQAFRKFAEIESQFDPTAKAKTSSASGLFQITKDTAERLGLSDPFNPLANADAAARLWKENESGLTEALGRAPTAGELYLAHQQGLRGAKLLLSNPDAKAVDLLGAKAVLNNGGSANMSAKDFADKWLSRFGGGEKNASSEEENAPTSTFPLQDRFDAGYMRRMEMGQSDNSMFLPPIFANLLKEQQEEKKPIYQLPVPNFANFRLIPVDYDPFVEV